MTPFLRVFVHSLRYRWSIAGTVASALLVGLLWGLSIGTLYPFLQVIFEGQTAQSLVERKAEQCRTEQQEAQQKLAALEQRQRTAPAARRPHLETQIQELRQSIQHLERRAAVVARLRRHVLPYLPATPFATLVLLMGLLVLATLIKGFLLVINVTLVGRISAGTVRDLRRIYFARTLTMSQKRVDKFGTTRIMTLLSHNLNMVGAGLRSIFGQSIREPLKMLACLAGAAFICWRLLLLSLIVAPFGALIVHTLTVYMRRAAAREMGGMNIIFQTLIETLNSLKIVRVYNREAHELRRFKNDAEALYRMQMKITFFDALIRPVTEIAGILTIVIAILCGAYLVLNNRCDVAGIKICEQPLSPSILFVFYGMLAGISDPARKMGDIYAVLVRGNLACRSLSFIFEDEMPVQAIRSVLAAEGIPIEKRDGKPAVRPPVKRKRTATPTHCKRICFEKVSFHYRPGQVVLKDINLDIPFRQTVALVGENGCGKSTLVNLLARFYDPTDGRVYLDGVNMRQFSARQLRRQYGLVTQDAILFQGTIWENLRYSAPRASREQILAAARMARVADFVETLPQGYETEVGDQGRCLSGGQRQRVALARALLRDPRIMILDEATSQVDRQAEAQIHGALAEFLRDRTTILVTHRLSSIRLADRVVVLDRGRIVGDMTADEYLQRHGGMVVPRAA